MCLPFMPDIEKSYRELARKHQLPEYSKLNHEFEVSLIENEGFLLRQVIHAMSERIEFFTMLIDSMLHPESGQLAPLHECRFFDDREKEELYNLYKALMQHHRTALLAGLQREEKAEAAFITSFFKEWQTLKPNLISMAMKMRQSWEKDTTIREVMGYFG